MQLCLFIRPCCRDVYYSTPLVSIKIGKFSVISEAYLHVKCGIPFKFVSSHIRYTLSLLELSWVVVVDLTVIYLRKKSSLERAVCFGVFVLLMPWYFRSFWVVVEGSFMLKHV